MGNARGPRPHQLPGHGPVGTRDLILPVTGAKGAERKMPSARVERLPGLGHVPMFDDPDKVASALLEGTGSK